MFRIHMYGPGFCFRTCPMLSCAHVLHRLHASSPAGFVMTRSAATGINRRRLSKASHLHVPAPLSPAVFTLAVFTLRTLVRGRHLVQILYHVMYHTSAARCCYTAALPTHQGMVPNIALLSRLRGSATLAPLYRFLMISTIIQVRRGAGLAGGRGRVPQAPGNAPRRRRDQRGATPRRTGRGS